MRFSSQVPRLTNTLLLRSVAVALLFSTGLIVSPAATVAAAGRDGSGNLVQIRDETTDAFLARLLDEINARREAVGTRRLSFVAGSANGALDEFLTFVAPTMMYPNPCMHQAIGDALAWDYVAGTGVEASPLGEVLACPGPGGEGYWTPSRTAESWWASPVHADILYADPDANAIACGAYAPRRSGRSVAAAAVLCVTYHD